ncbi:hypothetical protein ACFU3O_14440 [Streptomyces antibioticus]|uniref:hypothetical protein n=1 Tax=Streptomyces antibioticus TaxID=1890 RepID=UPI0036B5CA33
MTRRQPVDDADLTRRPDATPLKKKVPLLTGGVPGALTAVTADSPAVVRGHA